MSDSHCQVEGCSNPRATTIRAMSTIGILLTDLCLPHSDLKRIDDEKWKREYEQTRRAGDTA